MSAALELSKEDDLLPDCPRGDWKAGSECLNCRQALDCIPFERALLESSGRLNAEQQRCFSIRPDIAPMIVSEQGTTIGLSSGRLEVKKNGECLGSVRLNEISSIQLNGAIQISTQALREVSERGIPVLLCSQSGYLNAQINRSTNRDGLARVLQIKTASHSESSLQLAKKFVTGKIHNQWVLLRRRSGKSNEAVSKLKHSLKRIQNTVDKNVLLGIEGEASKTYFRGLSTLIGKQSEFKFESRTRRPPLDPFNAILSYSYAILHTEVLKAVLAAGLDPAVGFLHEIHAGRDSLVCDLVEEFRSPIVDTTALSLVNRRQISYSEFRFEADGGCYVQSDAKKTILKEIERRLRESVRHPVFGYRVSWRRAIQLQAIVLKHSLVSGTFEWQPFYYR